MLLAGSGLKGYAVEASDGRIGAVNDLLFDDTTWKVRWLVVDTGTWLTGRKVLIHPSSIAHIDYEHQELPVHLTRAQVRDSPDVAQDAPVSRQMQDDLYSYYNWDPLWGVGNYFGGYPGLIGGPVAMPVYQQNTQLLERPGTQDGDPHLRSVAEIIGYHVDASDGRIGHVLNVLMDDASWGIHYIIVDTKDWWFGQHVLVSPFAVKGIDWPEHEIRTDLSRDQVKASPPWDPAAAIDPAYEQHLHGYYGWPGYSW